MTGRISRLVTALFLFSLLLLPSVALAQEASNNEVSLNLSSDKSEYNVGDIATFTLSVTNVGDSDIVSSHSSFELPSGMEAVDLLQIEQDLGSIASGETKDIEVKARVVSSDLIENSNQIDSNNSASEDIEKTSLAQTGDFNPLLIFLLVAFIAAGVGIVVSVKTRHNILSILLVVGVASGVTLSASQYAFADDVNKSLSVEQKVSVVGSVGKVCAVLTYSVDSSSDPSGSEEDTISRAQWISELLTAVDEAALAETENPFKDIDDSKYRDEILTAYALGILPETGAEYFEPNKPATREFAATTATLIAGFTNDGAELIANDADESTFPELLAIAVDTEIITLDNQGNVNPNRELDRTTADSILLAIKAFLTPAEGEEVAQVEYQDDVVVIEDYEVTEAGYVIDSSRYRLSSGQKVAFSGTENDDGIAGVVTEISGVSGTTSFTNPVVISFDQITDPYEVFKSIEISASNKTVDLSQAELAEGVEWVSDSQARTAKASLGKFKLKHELNGISAIVGIEPTVNVDAKWSWSSGLERCDFSIKSEVESELTAQKKIGDSVKLLTVPVPLSHGFEVDLTMYLEYEVGGKASISASVDSLVGVKYTNGHFSSYKDSDSELSASLEAKGKAGVSLSGSLTFLKIDLIDVTPEIGVEASGSETIRDTGMVCNDVSGFLYAEVNAGEKTAWMNTAGLTYSAQIWNKKNSPAKLSVHLEDGVFVEKCTYGSSGSEGGGSEEGDEGYSFEYAIGDYWTSNKGVVEGDLPENITYGYGGQFEGSYEWEGGGVTYSGSDCGHGAYITYWYTGYEDEDVIVIPETIEGEKVVYANIEIGDGQTVDISQASGLVDLSILTGDGSLKLGNNQALECVTLKGGRYDVLDFSSLGNIEYFAQDGADIQSLIISGNDSIRSVYCGASAVERIDVSDSKNLDSFDLFSCYELDYLNCSNCALKSFNSVFGGDILSELPMLAELYCDGNYLEDTSALEAWLEEEGHSGKVNPQKSNQ